MIEAILTLSVLLSLVAVRWYADRPNRRGLERRAYELATGITSRPWGSFSGETFAIKSLCGNTTVLGGRLEHMNMTGYETIPCYSDDTFPVPPPDNSAPEYIDYGCGWELKNK